ncbi:MAG: winged helix-turn-helix transcriptional regulator [Alphaproteobacteria bacterium]|nr:winged helix-turn-helix transcriptional regulator [Alphaproteobacteria bacterium]
MQNRLGEALVLDGFLPYRLSVLTNHVSSALASRYAEDFSLSAAEWRVMAALGGSAGLSASEVCLRTAMDKVQVSRAVANLVENGRVVRRADAEDGRVTRLTLSAAGRAVYDEIVPRAKEFEARLVSVLTSEEQVALDAILKKLTRSVLSL